MPCLCGSEIWVILCVIVEEINNMLLCVKKKKSCLYILACCINMKIVINGNFM